MSYIEIQLINIKFITKNCRTFKRRFEIQNCPMNIKNISPLCTLQLVNYRQTEYSYRNDFTRLIHEY